MASSLYETDYQRWLQTMVHHLQERNFDAINWNHLIEELESMGKSVLLPRITAEQLAPLQQEGLFLLSQRLPIGYYNAS